MVTSESSIYLFYKVNLFMHTFWCRSTKLVLIFQLLSTQSQTEKAAVRSVDCISPLCDDKLIYWNRKTTTKSSWSWSLLSVNENMLCFLWASCWQSLAKTSFQRRQGKCSKQELAFSRWQMWAQLWKPKSAFSRAPLCPLRLRFSWLSPWRLKMCLIMKALRSRC